MNCFIKQWNELLHKARKLTASWSKEMHSQKIIERRPIKFILLIKIIYSKEYLYWGEKRLLNWQSLHIDFSDVSQRHLVLFSSCPVLVISSCLNIVIFQWLMNKQDNFFSWSRSFIHFMKSLSNILPGSRIRGIRNLRP